MALQGRQQVERALTNAVDAFQSRLAGALYVVANNVATDAARITPHDTGTLMGSDYVALPAKTATGASVELGFGGFAEDYAVVQHEDTSFAHDEGRQAHYLSDPIDREKPRFVSDVASALRMGASRGSAPTNPMQGGLKPKLRRTAKQKAAAAHKAARKLKPRKTRRRA